MVIVTREKEGGLQIMVELEWDKEKRDWADGVYVSMTNGCAHILFKKQAEAELRQALKELGDNAEPSKEDSEDVGAEKC